MTTSTIKLPSGASATIRKGQGRDLRVATKLCEAGDEGGYGLIAVLARIDGRELDLAGVLGLPLPDVLALQAAVTPAPSADPKKLPSGKAFAVKNGTGHDLLKAQRLAGPDGDVGFALIAALATVEDEAIYPDVLLDMDLGDVLALQAAVQTQVPTQALSTSPS